MVHNRLVVNQAGDEVRIYGIITPDGGDNTTSFMAFKSAFQQALNMPGSDVTVRINSVGGSITEGLAIYDMMMLCNKNITTVVEGMAASMAGIVALAGNDRAIYPNATFMIHRAQGMAYGDADEIDNYAKNVRAMENQLKGILQSRTKMSKKQVDDFMKTGMDNWIGAEDAIKFGLATRIDQKAANNTIPAAALLKGQKPEDVYKQYYAYNLKTNDTQMNEKLKAALVALFGSAGVTLPAANAAEDDFATSLTAVQTKLLNLTVENSTLKNAAANAKVAEVDALIANAINAKLIANQADIIDAFKKLGEISIDTLKNTLEGLKPVEIKTMGNPPTNTDADTDEDKAREKWTWNDWSKNDPTALAKMEIINEAKYHKLLDAHLRIVRSGGQIAK